MEPKQRNLNFNENVIRNDICLNTSVESFFLFEKYYCVSPLTFTESLNKLLY